MYFKQFYLGCLAHASYLIGSEGEAVVVDPQRDVDEYLTEASAQGFQIKYVIETHLHADFVSGHQEIAARTGAQIVFGEKAGAEFEHRAVKEGEELRIGKVVLKFIETPGHTPEGICVLVTDTENARRTAKTLNRRHALHRRRRPSGSRRRQRLHAADDGRDDVRQSSRQTAETAR